MATNATISLLQLYNTSDLRLQAVVFSPFPSSVSVLFTANARRQPPITPSIAVSTSISLSPGPVHGSRRLTAMAAGGGDAADNRVYG
jgi:hypothetical protein